MEATGIGGEAGGEYALAFGEVSADNNQYTSGDETLYDTELRTGTWLAESVLPPCLEWLLALRRSVTEYEAAGMILPLGGKPQVEPEARLSSERSHLSVPRLYPPLLGYPIPSGGSLHTLVVTDTPGIAGMKESIRELRRYNSSWCFPSARAKQLSGHAAVVLAKAYTDVPLHAYTDLAREEVKLLVGTERVWANTYREQTSQVLHPGMYGVLHDNTLIDVSRGTDSGTDGGDTRDPSERRHMSAWNGFIDCTFTPASLEAGKIRSLVHGCRYRLLTGAVLDKMERLLALVHDNHRDERHVSDSQWLLTFMGCSETVPTQTVSDIRRVWRTMRGHDTPSLHLFPKLRLVALAVTPGCIMRPLSVSQLYDESTANQQLWIDSFAFGRAEMMSVLGLTAPSLSVPSEYVRTAVLLGPYAFYDQPPRPLLAGAMAVQAVCRPRCEISSTTAPIHSCLPVVRTPLMDRVANEISSVQNVNVPGFPLLTLFANMTQNYEDSVIVSSAINRLGVFAHKGVVYHPVPPNVTGLAAGRVLGRADSWWRPYDDGTVIREGVSRAKTRYVAASMEHSALRLGDKIATQHGQKFVVSQIVDESEMPLCVSSVTGEQFRPHIVVASSSVHNRVTPGQVYEAYAGMAAVGRHDFDPRTVTESVVTSVLGQECKTLQPFTCSILDSNSTPVVAAEGNAVIADYGACHYWLLGHLARDKQHYMSSVPRTAAALRGRLRGAAVRLGEMEVHAMLEAGLIHTLSELSESADLVTVPVCVACRRLSILCDCPSEHQVSTNVAVRSSLVRFDIHRAVYTVNGQMSGASDSSSLDESTERFVAESLRYHA